MNSPWAAIVAGIVVGCVLGAVMLAGAAMAWVNIYDRWQANKSPLRAADRRKQKAREEQLRELRARTMK